MNRQNAQFAPKGDKRGTKSIPLIVGGQGRPDSDLAANAAGFSWLVGLVAAAGLLLALLEVAS